MFLSVIPSSVDLTSVQETGSMVGDLGDKSISNVRDVKDRTFNETRSKLLSQAFNKPN